MEKLLVGLVRTSFVGTNRCNAATNSDDSTAAVPAVKSSYWMFPNLDHALSASRTGKIGFLWSSATKISRSTQSESLELGETMTINAPQEMILFSIVGHQRSPGASSFSSIQTAKPVSCSNPRK